MATELEMTEKDIDAVPPMAQKMYAVRVQMQYRVPAVDGADAIAQIMHDMGQGRSYKYALEDTLDVSALPIPNAHA